MYARVRALLSPSLLHYLSISLSVYLSINVSICLSIYLYLYLSIYLYIRLSISMYCRFYFEINAIIGALINLFCRGRERGEQEHLFVNLSISFKNSRGRNKSKTSRRASSRLRQRRDTVLILSSPNASSLHFRRTRQS